MEKEIIIKWLRICGDSDGSFCDECPFAGDGDADCGGALMLAAADALEE